MSILFDEKIINNIMLNRNISDKDKKDIKLYYGEYRNYNTIRRNLREAYKSIEYCLEVSNNIDQIKKKSDEEKEAIFYVCRKELFYAITLYARWFVRTEDKPKLNAIDFFGEDTYEIEAHKYIRNLRNKCIAHNEKDILELDIAKIYIDENKKIMLESEWQKLYLESNENLKNIKKCIEIVHNKIDGDILPNIQVEFEQLLNSNYEFIVPLI